MEPTFSDPTMLIQHLSSDEHEKVTIISVHENLICVSQQKFICFRSYKTLEFEQKIL